MLTRELLVWDGGGAIELLMGIRDSGRIALANADAKIKAQHVMRGVLEAKLRSVAAEAACGGGSVRYGANRYGEREIRQTLGNREGRTVGHGLGSLGGACMEASVEIIPAREGAAAEARKGRKKGCALGKRRIERDDADVIFFGGDRRQGGRSVRGLGADMRGGIREGQTPLVLLGEDGIEYGSGEAQIEARTVTQGRVVLDLIVAAGLGGFVNTVDEIGVIDLNM